MTAILSLPFQQLSLKDAPGQSSASNLVRESQATLTRKMDWDITITTLEGDRFTLSADSALSLSASTYSRMDVGGSRTVKRETDTQSVAGSNQVAASAAGNFNPEEMRDIVKALRQFLKIARDILRGHLVQAGNRADTLSKLDSLQSIEASFQVWNQVTSQDRLAIENAAPEIVPAESSSSPATGTVSAQA